MKPQIHLLCNAHLDPVWLWEWQEGAAEAISTFRTAAELCEEFGNFVFNHNEVILYEWVRQYEPQLFTRIQKLVKQGRWRIMGGWYLQPDCNMPSGESFVRQIETGRRYFKKYFNARPTTAINFDPFGHSRGLVQIMTQAGYDSYIICRPLQADIPLEQPVFRWKGFDGSSLLVCRPSLWYNSPLGGAAKKVQQQMSEHPADPCALLLWGVGNHGGGPSRQDLRDLRELLKSTNDFDIRHSSAEDFFEEFQKRCAVDKLPTIERDFNPWAPGCYTSQAKIKHHHRSLENELFSTEKMLATAAKAGVMPYPAEPLAEAERDLLFSQFHDILPGSSIEAVETASLRLMDHGLEILSRLKLQAFIGLAAGQPKARPGEIPLLVYNPHPYPVRVNVACEFQLADSNWTETWTLPSVFQKGRPVDSQVEKEASNLTLDWRKKVIFSAELQPSCMNRFDVRLEVLPTRPLLKNSAKPASVEHATADLQVRINARTGLFDYCRVGGVDVLKAAAIVPLVIRDNEDPWGMVRSFREVAGQFRLMTPLEAGATAGVRGKPALTVKTSKDKAAAKVEAPELNPVRIIEDGPVRTVVEVMFIYDRSAIIAHYMLPKKGTQIEIVWRVLWQQPNAMLKMSIATTLAKNARYLGQTAFGVHELPTNGDECVAQKWVGLCDQQKDLAVTLINEGVYGSDCANGEIRMSLLRSPAYSGHPIADRPIVPQDRHSPRIDIGQHVFRFWLNAGTIATRLDVIDRESLVQNERPMALSFFPTGDGQAPPSGPSISGRVVQCSAVYAENKSHIVRLYNPTNRRQKTTLRWPGVCELTPVDLSPWQFKTLTLNEAEA